MINLIQNKSFCVCMVYISVCVYINTHTYSIYFENIYIYIFLDFIWYINIFNI